MANLTRYDDGGCVSMDTGFETDNSYSIDDEQQSWRQVEQLCNTLLNIAVAGARGQPISEHQKAYASNLAAEIHSSVPASPADLLLQLRESNVANTAPGFAGVSSSAMMDSPNGSSPSMNMSGFNQRPAPFGSRKELVQTFVESAPRSATAVPVADARKCDFCGSCSSPEWRKGPNGPKTLCNACGLVYAKMVKTRKVPSRKMA